MSSVEGEGMGKLSSAGPIEKKGKLNSGIINAIGAQLTHILGGFSEVGGSE